MIPEELLTRLRACEGELRSFGITGLSLFGSTARGEDRDGSDIDLAATFDLASRVDLFRFAEIGERLHRLLDSPVDLVAGTGAEYPASGPDRPRPRTCLLSVSGCVCRDVVENIDRIDSYLVGSDRLAFSADTKTIDAVERCLQRITEAVIKIGSDRMAVIAPVDT